MIMMIMNMQNKLYRIQFFSSPDNQFAARKKKKKFELPAKRGFKLPES